MSEKQLELWNDSPAPWRKAMEQDAFELAFPDHERVDGDSVTVEWLYNHCQGGYCSTCAYHEESDLEVVITWSYPTQLVSRFNPENKRGMGTKSEVTRFDRGDALGFWLDLMSRGSK